MLNNRITRSNRAAFTMIELVFVIVVLGILAAMALPRMDRDQRQGAADEILSSIRYTQHIALQDYKHDSNDPKWQQKFWKIMFADCPANGLYYRIGSDESTGGNGLFAEAEAARDPLNRKPLFADNGNCGDDDINENILLGKRFGVSLTNTSGGCAGIQHIGFDHLGRPHVSYGASTIANYASYMDQRCTLSFSMSDGETFDITIEPETGYAEVVNRS
ncbi:MAG: prepilin-type N-terminal cleavage/methylation domain-containing protein [Sulfurimonas sp.]